MSAWSNPYWGSPECQEKITALQARIRELEARGCSARFAREELCDLEAWNDAARRYRETGLPQRIPMKRRIR